MYSIFLTICLILSSLMFSSSVWCSPLEINECSIDGVEIGSNVSELYSKIGKKFIIKSYKESGTAERIIIFMKNSVIGEFHISDSGKIIQGEIISDFIAPQNINRRSSLGEIMKAYGRGNIDPTETGYYVWFDKFPSVSFLINNEDIPKNLRNIPDDALTKKQEISILKLKRARIKSVRVSCNKEDEF